MSCTRFVSAQSIIYINFVMKTKNGANLVNTRALAEVDPDKMTHTLASLC